MATRLVTLILCASAIVLGCSRSGGVVTVWTDSSEIVAYSEVFNATRSDIKVVVRHRSDLVASLRSAAAPPDLIIGSYLATSTVMSQMSATDQLISRSALSREDFYPAFLALGKWNDRQVLLPVSFDLPMIVSLSDGVSNRTTEFIVSADELRDAAADFNVTSGNRFTHVGFSPRWDGRFLAFFVQMSGAGFREGADGTPEWDHDRLIDATDRLSDWIVEANRSRALDAAFSERYLYDPLRVLLDRGRIAFVYKTASEYFEQNDLQRRTTRFSWPAENRIPVLDSVKMAGIPDRAANRPGAEQFVVWLLNADVQKNLLERARERRMRSFGIAGGFSALIQLNEDWFPNFYPELLGMMPQEPELRFPQRLPRNWSAIVDEVVIPWVDDMISARNGAGSFDERLKTWLLRHGE